MMTAMEKRAAREAAKIRASGVKVANLRPAKDDKPTVASLEKRVDAMQDRLNEVIDALQAANVIE